jgi:hypothetical protein
MTKDIYESFDKMIELCHHKIKLMIELRNCLRIADLLGIPAKDLKGKVTHDVIEGGSLYFPWRSAVFVVTHTSNTQQISRRLPITDVHMDLWPDELRSKYERYQQKRRRDEQSSSGSSRMSTGR